MPKISVFHVKHMSHTNISGTQLPVYLQGVGKKKKKNLFLKQQ